jgi:hypothetical protein
MAGPIFRIQASIILRQEWVPGIPKDALYEVEVAD